jgi:type IV secretory pathway VirJ component
MGHFETFHVRVGLARRRRPTAAAVAPEVAKLRGLRVLRVQGADETDSLCPTLDTSIARRMVLAGGHHFGGDYGPITARMLAEAGFGDQPPNGSP